MCCRKQTRVIATISDQRCDEGFVRQLHRAGMNVARLNTAHQSPEESLKIVNVIRRVSDRIGILIDTKGPEIRTVGLEESLTLTPGAEVLIGADVPAGQGFAVSYDRFAEEVPVGTRILIDDGEVALTVEKASGGVLRCRAPEGGVIKNKKSVNVPGVHVRLPSLTARDREYVDFAIKNDIDFIAHSFVRSREDVMAIQSILDTHRSRVKIISKIENQEGVDHLDEILDCSFGVMIARGDMGIEIPAEQVPNIQKRIINACILRARPVITATQMLHSMIENPRPTRAEVSDVANAVYDGTDALMLSGETAYGKYPIEAITTMSRVAMTAEEQNPALRDHPPFVQGNHTRNYLARTAVRGALEMGAKGILTDTETGETARVVSSYRGRIPIYAKTHDRRVMRELSLSYGVVPTWVERPHTTDEMVTRALSTLLDDGEIERDETVFILAGTPDHSGGSNFLEVTTPALALDDATMRGQTAKAQPVMVSAGC